MRVPLHPRSASFDFMAYCVHSAISLHEIPNFAENSMTYQTVAG